MKINEALTDVVFHHRSIQTAAKILEKDQFMTSVAYGTPSDMAKNKGKLYYISFARSPRGSYASYEKGNALFQFDGRKLNQKFAGAPVDYWETGFTITRDSDEMEDRLFTNEPYIDQISKYITAIHLSAPIDAPQYDRAYVYHPTQVDAMKIISEKGKEMGIPTFFYPSISSYRSLDKRKSITSYEDWEREALKSEWVEIQEKTGSDWKSPYEPGEDLKRMVKIIDHLLVQGKSIEELKANEELYKYAYNRLFGWSGRADEIAQRIKTEVHNLKRDPRVRPAIAELGRILLKRKQNIDEISQELSDIWRKS